MKVRQNELDTALAPRKMEANKKQRNQFANSIKILGNASLGPRANHHNGSNLKGLSQEQKSSIKSFKVGIQKQFKKSNDIDTIVNQFLMVRTRTIPRECATDSVIDISCLSTVLVDESSFAFDRKEYQFTGRILCISTNRKKQKVPC